MPKLDIDVHSTGICCELDMQQADINEASTYTPPLN